MQDDGYYALANEIGGAEAAISFPVSFLDDLSKAQSTDDIISVLQHWVPRFIETDHFSINLKIDDDHLSAFAFGRGQEISEASALSIEGTAIGHCYLTKQLHLTPDASAPDIEEADLKILAGNGLRCVLNVPLLVAGACLGTISIAHETRRFYGLEHARIFQSLAGWIASNIHMHQHVEQLIKRGQEANKFAIIAERSNDILIIADKDRKIQWVNQAFEKSTEYSLEDAVGKTAPELFCGPDTDPEVMARIADDIASGKEAHGEVISYNKSGRKIWVHVNVQPIFDKNGNVEMVVSTNREITEAKLAEEKLRESDAQARKLAIIAERSNDILIISDKDRKIQWVNQAFVKNSGYSFDEAIGKVSIKLFCGEKTDLEVLRKIEKDISLGKEARGEAICYGKYGQEFWLDIDIQPVFDEAGEIEMYISNNRVITEAKLAEKKLQDSEAQAKQLAIFAEQTGDMILITNQAREITWVNTAFEKTYGYKFEDVVGLPPVSFLQGPATSSETLQKMHLQLQRGETVNEEIKFYSKSGEEIWVQINLHTIVNDHNEPEGIVGIQHDISKLKQRESELKKAREEADRSNRLKSEFLANMSHEIRTPLNGVLGMAQLLERSELDETQRKFTEIICSSGKSLLSIINDVLDISKVEAGLLELEEECFDVDDLIRQTIDTVSGIAVEKGLSLSREIALTGCGEFMGDAKRIRQILINLAGNAVKFTKQGSVHISVAKAEDCGLRFIVKDSGPGISVEQQQTIFERFRQADGSSTRTHGGTGLGLAISADLVALMGGEIGVISTPGQGAQFWFTLPLMETENALKDAVGGLRDVAAKTQEQGAQETIKLLLTEDNIVNQKVVIAALKMEGGFDVCVAENGVEALECLEEQLFDVVLMDIQMPVMNGDEAIQKIRASGKSYADVPIIALTANAMNDACKEYLNIGASAYHSKPINIEELIAGVRKLVAAKSSLTSVA